MRLARSPLFAAALASCLGCGDVITESTTHGAGGTSTSATGGTSGTTTTGGASTSAGGTGTTSNGGTAGNGASTGGGGTVTVGGSGGTAGIGGSTGSGGVGVPTTLDPTFGDAGLLTETFGFNAAWVYTGVRAADGSIVIISSTEEVLNGFVPAMGDALFVRMTTDGQLDTSFGVSGQALSAIHTPTIPRGAALQSDGKILITGYATIETALPYPRVLFVARFDENGTLDPTFGGGAGAIADISGEGRGVALQSDGKILATESFNGRVYRFEADGTLDATFGTDGHVDVPQASQIAVAPDDSIVISSLSNMGTSVTRLLPDGTFDPTFGSGGVAALDDVKDASCLALEPGGKVLVSGAHKYFPFEAALARIDTDGALDTTFGGGDGLYIHAQTGSTFGRVAALEDGNIAVLGKVDSSPLAVMRFTADGLPDPTFGTLGISSPLAPDATYAGPMFALADGSIIGTSRATTPAVYGGKPLAWRVLPTGDVDGAFAGDGRFEHDTHAAAELAHRTTVLGDGSFVSAGSIAAATHVGIMRHASDGVLDAAFGDSGLVADETLAILEDMVASDTGVWLTGSAGSPMSGGVTITRYTAAGQLDMAFGTNGVQNISASIGGYSRARAIELGPDGTVLVAGQTGQGSGLLFVARLTSDGSLDLPYGPEDSGVYKSGVGDITRDLEVRSNGAAYVLRRSFAGSFIVEKLTPGGTSDISFGGAGYVVHTLDVPDVEMDRLAILPDGKLLVAGYAGDEVVVARLVPQGWLDLTFGVDALVQVPLPGLRPNGFGDHADGPAIVLSPDGSFYVVGATRIGLVERVAVARITPSGQLDTTFGDAGWIVTGGAGNWAAYDATLLGGGKLLVTCRGFSDATGSDFGWLRLTP